MPPIVRRGVQIGGRLHAFAHGVHYAVERLAVERPTGEQRLGIAGAHCGGAHPGQGDAGLHDRAAGYGHGRSCGCQGKIAGAARHLFKAPARSRRQFR